MARLEWRSERQQQDPDAFHVMFSTWVPRLNYEAYLESDLWTDIRSRVLDAAGHRCACCPSKATQVHHRDYRPRVLSGEDLTPLVPICKRCHRRVHHDGEKIRDRWQDIDRALIEMVRQKDASVVEHVELIVENGV
jgi:5-methylcytosine-specific restriction endonuclease McrA